MTFKEDFDVLNGLQLINRLIMKYILLQNLQPSKKGLLKSFYGLLRQTVEFLIDFQG
jgi:hypothetical protein